MAEGRSLAPAWKKNDRSTVVADVKDVGLETIRARMTAALPRLRRFALSLAGNAADADDLVQDTVERALRNLHKWKPDTKLESWMFRIAQNLWIDQLRARKVRMADPIEEAHVAEDGARAAEAKLTLADTARALQRLPEEQRAVVALVLIEGIAYREAAEILGVPIGTVTSRLARAREALAAQLFGKGAAIAADPT
ncbi:MAG TPA: RNA polymerase sigma factor [Rhizomicrobium sp.]|nr:RNA polymerase sigma factor [Rhizomicrobium sp.]